MSGMYLIRSSVGFMTCLAVVATGWNAEAGWRHRRSACCEPVCCEPVYYEPVYYEPVCCGTARKTTCCEPVRETRCCETVVVTPVQRCCGDSFAMAGQDAPNGLVSIVTKETGTQADATRGTQASPVSLKR